MQYIEKELTLCQLHCLGELIPLELLEKLLKKGTFIAGGSVVYVLVDDVDKDTVGDIDVFIDDESPHSTTQECAELIDDYFATAQKYFRQQSTLKIYSETDTSKCPIQLIRGPGNLYNVIDSFDFDYVCCAITLRDDKFISVCTSYAAEAHKTHTIRYMLDYPYNPLRLFNRLSKAANKGFVLPPIYIKLGDLDISFYKPRRYYDSRKQKQELEMVIPHAIYDKNFPLSPSSTFPVGNFHTSLSDALKETLHVFTRADYEIPPITDHMRTHENQYHEHSKRYIYLPDNKNEARYVIVPDNVKIGAIPKIRDLEIDGLIERYEKDSLTETHTAYVRLRASYIVRALREIKDSNYDTGVGSALSDSLKLNGDKGGLHSFGLGMEMAMYYQSPRTRYDALQAIGRIFNLVPL